MFPNGTIVAGDIVCPDKDSICSIENLDRTKELNLKFYPRFKGVKGNPHERIYRFPSVEFLTPTVSHSELVGSRQTVEAIFKVIGEVDSLTVAVTPNTNGWFSLQKYPPSVSSNGIYRYYKIINCFKSTPENSTIKKKFVPA